MKVLFICKHNIFRSRVAEEYLKKISNHNVSSAGIIKGHMILKTQLSIAKGFGLDISYNPKELSINLLREQNKIIVIANNVPRSIFDNSLYKTKNKIEFWNMKDIELGAVRIDTRKIIKKIIKKIDKWNDKNDKRKSAIKN